MSWDSPSQDSHLIECSPDRKSDVKKANRKGRSEETTISAASGGAYNFAGKPGSILKGLLDILAFEVRVALKYFLPGRPMRHLAHDYRYGYPHAADAGSSTQNPGSKVMRSNTAIALIGDCRLFYRVFLHG
jgi:hypothetical protein